MTRARLLLPLLTALSLALAGCLPGPETLLERTRAEVIITGARPGDVIHLEVDDTVRETLVESGAPLHLYLDLAPGTHEGALVVERRGVRLCARFLVDVPETEGRAVTSVDLRAAHRCEEADDGGPDDGGPDDGGPDDSGPDSGGPDDGGPDDAGLDDGGPDDAGLDDAGELEERFVYLREDEVSPDCMGMGNPCVLSRVTATAEGALEVDHGDGESQAMIPDGELALLVEAAMSPEADALFAGESPQCEQPRPGQSGALFLERRRRLSPQGPTLTETIDVTGCGGIAQELRLRLRFLRDLLTPPRDGG